MLIYIRLAQVRLASLMYTYYEDIAEIPIVPDSPAYQSDVYKLLSGPETGKRKRVTRKADGKLTESWRKVNLGGSWHGKADVFGYPFQLTHFSLPVSGPLNYEDIVEIRVES